MTFVTSSTPTIPILFYVTLRPVIYCTWKFSIGWPFSFQVKSRELLWRKEGIIPGNIGISGKEVEKQKYKRLYISKDVLCSVPFYRTIKREIQIMTEHTLSFLKRFTLGQETTHRVLHLSTVTRPCPCLFLSGIWVEGRQTSGQTQEKKVTCTNPWISFSVSIFLPCLRWVF